MGNWFSIKHLYAEAGQVSDIGYISTIACQGEVLSVKRKENFIVHTVKILAGMISLGDTTDLKVKQSFRMQYVEPLLRT